MCNSISKKYHFEHFFFDFFVAKATFLGKNNTATANAFKKHRNAVFILIFIVQYRYLHIGSFQHLLSQFIRIRICINNPLNTSIDQYFSTDNTRLMSTIQRTSVNGYAMISGLNNGILLSMDTAAFVRRVLSIVHAGNLSPSNAQV